LVGCATDVVAGRGLSSYGNQEPAASGSVDSDGVEDHNGDVLGVDVGEPGYQDSDCLGIQSGTLSVAEPHGDVGGSSFGRGDWVFAGWWSSEESGLASRIVVSVANGGVLIHAGWALWAALSSSLDPHFLRAVGFGAENSGAKIAWLAVRAASEVVSGHHRSWWASGDIHAVDTGADGSLLASWAAIAIVENWLESVGASKGRPSGCATNGGARKDWLAGSATTDFHWASSGGARVHCYAADSRTVDVREAVTAAVSVRLLVGESSGADNVWANNSVARSRA